METQGTRIKRFREKNGLTMEEVGKSIGLTKQAIYKYENDIVTNIPYDKILLLAKALHVEPWEILGWNAPDNDKVFKLSPDSATITIPFINQKLSAGTGADYLSAEDTTVRTISVLSTIARGANIESLVAAEVVGDSMIGEKIFSGDIVIFSRGLIRGSGIYVINYAGEVMVKKVTFDALENKVTIISANIDYPPKTVDADCIAILGKVLGWIHMENY